MIQVEGKCIIPSGDICDNRKQWYAEPKGFKRMEQRHVQSESDFSNGIWRRESDDNGKTWGSWHDIYQESFRTIGDNEVLNINFEPTVHHPINGHALCCGMQRIFLNGHTEAYKKYWATGEDTLIDHCFLVVKMPDGSIVKQLISYESKTEYDSEKINDPEYLSQDRAYFGQIYILKNGDIMFPICADIRYCCKTLGLDVMDVFPSCPQVTNGLIVVRGKWNTAQQRYELSYSRPVVLSDLQSSRGVMEPTLAELPNGRIIVVVRGSNVVRPAWNTRISKKAPGFKWYCYSDDDGNTFTPLLPWHFDTREVIYSSSTLSTLIHSDKNGKTYWIGNITDPCETDGNYMRWPLYIGEVTLDGLLKKDSLVMIDTKREGEADGVQLSNFEILQDRETGTIELRLAKIGQHPNKPVWNCESWVYSIIVEE